MAMYETEAFWQNFLRKPEAQEAYMIEQNQLILEQANMLKADYERETKEIADALQQCSMEVQRELRPILKFKMVHRLLHNVLQQCKNHGESFETKLREDKILRDKLVPFLEKEHTDAENDEEILENSWTKAFAEANNKSEAETEACKLSKNRSWKTMPEDELADRLAKGEILPREEWLPGDPKVKKKVNSVTLTEYLEFGEKLNNEGKEALESQDYDKALTLFTQGIELLKWIEADNEEEQYILIKLYTAHLRNSALAALKLGNSQNAIAVCSTILKEIDDHDPKALYRRALAYQNIGMVENAMSDFSFIIKSPFIDNSFKASARNAVKDVLKIVKQSRRSTNRFVTKSFRENIFSDNRKAMTSMNSNFFENVEGVDENEGKEDGDAEDSDKDGQYGGDDAGEDEEQEKVEAFKQSCEAPLSNEDVFLMLDETVMLLEELLNCYTSRESQKELGRIWNVSDYDERRFMINSKRFLLELQKPILKKYGFTGESHQRNLNVLRKNVAYWKRVDPTVGELERECWRALYGDCGD